MTICGNQYHNWNMENANAVIDDIMQAGLQDRYTVVHIPPQDETGWHSAIAQVKSIANPNAPVVLLKVQQYKRLNPREAFGLQVMSYCPGAIRSPELVEEGEVFTIQQLCPGTMLDSTIHSVPENYAEELGKLLAWQMFPPADVQILLREKMAISKLEFYPNGQFPKRIVATGTGEDVFLDDNERDNFKNILSIPHIGFDKGDWRLSNTLYNASVQNELFYSIDYRYSYIVTKNEPHLFEKRAAVFDLMLHSFGEMFAKRMIGAFLEKAKAALPR